MAGTKNPGDDLFSRKAALSVSSALESLTSVFGMGMGAAFRLSHRDLSRLDVSAVARRTVAMTMRGAGMDLRVVRVVSMVLIDPQPPTPGQLLKRSSPRPLVPLSFIRHRTSTCGLSNRWSPCGLTRLTRWGTSSRGASHWTLSTLIPTEHSYPAMPLAGQLAHHRSVHSGPLVLEATPLKYPTPTADRDRTVSRRSEPNSRTALIGEQPNPWDVIFRPRMRRADIEVPNRPSI